MSEYYAISTGIGKGFSDAIDLRTEWTSTAHHAVVERLTAAYLNITVGAKSQCLTAEGSQTVTPEVTCQDVSDTYDLLCSRCHRANGKGEETTDIARRPDVTLAAEPVGGAH